MINIVAQMNSLSTVDLMAELDGQFREAARTEVVRRLNASAPAHAPSFEESLLEAVDLLRNNNRYATADLCVYVRELVSITMGKHERLKLVMFIISVCLQVERDFNLSDRLDEWSERDALAHILPGFCWGGASCSSWPRLGWSCGVAAKGFAPPYGA